MTSRPPSQTDSVYLLIRVAAELVSAGRYGFLHGVAGRVAHSLLWGLSISGINVKHQMGLTYLATPLLLE